MKLQDFRSFCENRIIYLDGATGSMLVKEGMPSGVCPEKWIIDNPWAIQKVQSAYIQSGSDIILAPTFTANRIKLAEYGLQDNIAEINKTLVGLSRAVADSCKDRRVLVAGDMTMTGVQLKPIGEFELEALIDVYKEQVRILDEAGVDVIFVETMMSLAESRAALIAAREVCDLPVMVSMTFEPDGRTLYGTDAKSAGIVLESLGAAAIGVNCSTGPDKMINIIKDMASVTTIPIIAKPNAGLPKLDDKGNTFYDCSVDEFVMGMTELVNSGATLIGGCCGTNPEFIAAICREFGRVQTVTDVPRRISGRRYLASERKSIDFGLDDPFIIVGERINPTGKKTLQAELREGRFDRVISFAEEQEKCGAGILDVNMGMSGIDEKTTMLRAILEVTQASNLPISIDSSHVEVIEAALRLYPGRALINSISFEKEKMDKLIPIAAKYGAMFILLPLSDKGLPENIAEKIDIIDTLSQKAFDAGMTKEDIVVDGLVATIGANKKAGLETIETIKYCKANGYATICGLSNISFGMPERSYVNTAFVSMAITAGLTMAIANPSQEMLVATAYATDLLLNKTDSDLKYIETADYVKTVREAKEIKAAAMQQTAPASNGTGGAAADSTQKGTDEVGTKDKGILFNAVLKGNKNGIVKLTEEAVNAGFLPQDLLNDQLLPAINEVGELFDKGKYFLPQLIASAEAMKRSIEYLEPFLLDEKDDSDKPVVVIATVEGDIHDIGKNLVALMLKNYGFKVIDLGKDVPKEKIIEAAKEYNAQIVALSALMTTTMQRMKDVIELAKQKQIRAKVMIGGAVITQEYADEIHADGYSKDAADAVKLAQKLIEK